MSVQKPVSALYKCPPRGLHLLVLCTSDQLQLELSHALHLQFACTLCKDALHAWMVFRCAFQQKRCAFQHAEATVAVTCDCSTPTVSNSISQLQSLKDLDLSDSHLLRCLPEGITRITTLQKLALKRCHNLARTLNTGAFPAWIQSIQGMESI